MIIIIEVKKEGLFMKETMKQEMQCRVLQEELAEDNVLIQYYQDKEAKKIRFLSIEDRKMEDYHVSNNFDKIGEIIDPEIGLTTWYSRDGKRVEFNDKGIAAFDEDGRLSDLFDFSNLIWKRVEFDFLNTVYQRLFGKNPKEKQKSANNQ